MATLLVVVSTGNHYWLDAIVAMVVLAVASAIVERSEAARLRHRRLSPPGSPRQRAGSARRRHPGITATCTRSGRPASPSPGRGIDRPN
ncbi:hypothetical protein [Asanoa siamensis]|uniref:hypothetical protein n=1 Tax=Asanoa siamensis TaxID=926357 RepID=UPI003570DB4F